MLKSKQILGVKITTSKENEILEFIQKELAKPKGKRSKIVIFTPNPEQLSAAAGASSLKELLNKADVNLPDGIGVVAAAKLLGTGVEARVAGVDFMVRLIEDTSKIGTGISAPLSGVRDRPVVTGFFGGQKGVAIKAAECLRKITPKMTLGYVSDAFDKEKMIQSDIDILFVALGFPKQERWIIQHKDEIPATVIMGVGGAFDFWSGRITRAPKPLRDIGLEWLFRLILEPRRFGRQLRIWHFGGLIFREALSSRLKNLKIRI
jgi:N-acetylglucosaminyldiphosphoundecaprenol N-acetyl-beta-D-mannosaminyltransferase